FPVRELFGRAPGVWTRTERVGSALLRIVRPAPGNGCPDGCAGRFLLDRRESGPQRLLGIPCPPWNFSEEFVSADAFASIEFANRFTDSGNKFNLSCDLDHGSVIRKLFNEFKHQFFTAHKKRS